MRKFRTVWVYTKFSPCSQKNGCHPKKSLVIDYCTVWYLFLFFLAADIVICFDFSLCLSLSRILCEFHHFSYESMWLIWKYVKNFSFVFHCSENEILEHDSSFDVFYMSFAALAANNISGQCNARKYHFVLCNK